MQVARPAAVPANNPTSHATVANSAPGGTRRRTLSCLTFSVLMGRRSCVAGDEEGVQALDNPTEKKKPVTEFKSGLRIWTEFT